MHVQSKDFAFNYSYSNLNLNTNMTHDDINETNDVEYTTDDSDSEDDNRKKSKNKQCIDDGDDRLYEKRIKKLEKLDRAENKPESFTELDGGLRIPNDIWNRLYKFQKTGVKWLWELHGQRCGGILGD